MEFTQENFTYCIDNILTDISGYLLQPLEFITTQLDTVYQGLGTDIRSGRGMIDYIRSQYAIFTRDIMDKLLNSFIPIQPFLHGVKDINSKFLGGITVALYSFLGTFKTLQS